MKEIIKGYKVTDKDMKCRGFQYELGKEYTHSGKISLCNEGFHFCLKASDCYEYYDFNENNRLFEIETTGNVLHGEDKSVTDNIRLVKEIAWKDVFAIVNEGRDNTGRKNTGDRNTGDWNTGYSNTGNRNTGYSNTGNRNTGNRNTGNSNTGYSNTGDWNTGDWNTGYSNTGYRNTGDSNTGYSNTGDWNTGDSNTGYRNTGDSNTGYRNTGDRNTGDWNTGDWNTGYSNTGNRNTGVFCTGVQTIQLFDKPSNWTIQDFENSKAYSLLCNYVNTKMWVQESAMTDEEKTKYPSYKTTGGYLKDIPYKEAFTNAWHNWDNAAREAFTSLPNFDAEIFYNITGVKLA